MIGNEIETKRKALSHKGSRLAPNKSRPKGEEKPEEELIWKVLFRKP